MKGNYEQPRLVIQWMLDDVVTASGLDTIEGFESFDVGIDDVIWQ